MAQPIYKLFLARHTEAWHQLAQDEQNQLVTKVNEALEMVDGKRLILCTSGWASEQWPFWGVEQFPDIEAVQKHAELLNELNWLRYLETMTVLGTEWQPT
jgi:hypothetical protein